MHTYVRHMVAGTSMWYYNTTSEAARRFSKGGEDMVAVTGNLVDVEIHVFGIEIFTPHVSTPT